MQLHPCTSTGGTKVVAVEASSLRIGWCVWPQAGQPQPQIPLRVYVLLGRLSTLVFVSLSILIYLNLQISPISLSFPKHPRFVLFIDSKQLVSFRKLRIITGKGWIRKISINSLPKVPRFPRFQNILLLRKHRRN